MTNYSLRLLYYFLAVPGFLFTAFIGSLATWIDRKVTARLQWRVGPPIYQPFADLMKLLGKETFVPAGAFKAVFLAAPLIGLAAVTLVSTMLWILNVNTYSGFIGDLIVIIYFLMVPSLALMIGGSASRNPFSALGSSREMKLILAYELPFIIAAFTVVARCGTILIGGIVNFQAAHGMMISKPSGVLAFAVCLLVSQAKLGYVPFDMAEADQELIGGTLLEYSGAPLAVFRLTKAMMLFVLPVFLITMFLGGTGTAVSFIIKYAVILLLIILIKNTNPRLRIDQAVRFFWGPVAAAAVIGFILAMVGW